MHLFNVIAILLTLAAVLNYVNYRYIKLPTTIGLMLISLMLSLLVIAVGFFWPSSEIEAKAFLNNIDFNKTLLEGMLSFLLFAGALHVKLEELKKQKWIISILATLGVLSSTFLVGTGTYYILQLFGFQVSYIFCLLFGSLISPTDPIAVLGILKEAKASKSLETKIVGESLFNDGVGVVIFLVILSLATGEQEISFLHISSLLLFEAGGGIILGFILGYATFYLLKSVDNYQVEILLTLALTSGGYALAMYLHTSAPIAIVVAGLLVGNVGRAQAMSDNTKQSLDQFWELIDEILNAVLFVLIGLEVLVLNFEFNYLILGLICIPLVLLSRFISIGIPVSFLRLFRSFSPGAVQVITWAGLRGGISIALALALPHGPERDLFLTITYIVVIFSIIVQGLTVKKLVLSKMKQHQLPY
ncbi:sodium:proton antiporter [bacterium K02(2017)]|nr:sodium:proton antiporter [bacterium K02(2017)]